MNQEACNDYNLKRICDLEIDRDRLLEGAKRYADMCVGINLDEDQAIFDSEHDKFVALIVEIEDKK